MNNHGENNMTQEELDRIVAETDFAAMATRVAADEAVAPRGFTVRRFSDRVRVTHNRTTREFYFSRGADTYGWSAPVGNYGDTHRNSGNRSFATHDRTVASNPDWRNDVEARAVAWFRQAVQDGTAFVEDQD